MNIIKVRGRCDITRGGGTVGPSQLSGAADLEVHLYILHFYARLVEARVHAGVTRSSIWK